MSFTGTGILGACGWGTTTQAALEKQAAEVESKFSEVRTLLNTQGDTNFSTDNQGKQQKELPHTAAILSVKEYEWDETTKKDFMMKRTRQSSLTEEMIGAIEEWRQKQKEVLTKRQVEVQALPPHQRRLVDEVADMLSVVLIHIYLREILIYPLARDQLAVTGESLFMKAVKNNEETRDQARRLRDKLSQNLNDRTSWLANFTDVERSWREGWQWEQTEMLLPVCEYLKSAYIPTMVDASGSPAAPLPTPNPPPNHDLNYGQQLSQMFVILRTNHRRSGFLQGIPKPRQEPDWTCRDGFDSMPEICFEVPEKFIAEPGGRIDTSPNKNDVPTYLMPGEAVGHPDVPEGDQPAISVGAYAINLDKKPDAPSQEQRHQMEETQKKEKEETEHAIEAAHKAVYGNKLLEKLINVPGTVHQTVDKAKSYYQWLTSDKHTEDINGSFTKHEVNLALRNHGTHFEALSEDITPVGNHYLLIHFDVQHIKEEDYRLKVHGCVDKPSEWTLKNLRNFCPDAVIRQPLVMECSGNGRTLMKPRFNHHVPWELQAFGCYVWTGIPLILLLQQVGVQRDKAVDVVLTGYDAGVQENQLRHYQRAIEIDDPVLEHMMVCWENNGVPLLKEHGFPVRIMTPAWYGDGNVKWLQSIEVVDHKFKGRHMVSYSYTKKEFDTDISVPSQEIRPRAMLRPMGYPSFLERNRYIKLGTYTWVGKAWVGGGWYRGVMSVEVSLDAGKTWKRAKLEPRLGIFAWHRFSVDVTLDKVGIYKVVVRATDTLGHRQKVQLEPEDWNWHGMCDDACQSMVLYVVEDLTFTT